MQSIIFVHKGYSYYLELAIAQARLYNPECKIVLLGDDSNKCIRNIIHHPISEYKRRADEFDKCFFNVSPNRREYELFCFQRWFVIEEFMAMHPEYDDNFVYCDSDTLLYADVNKDLQRLAPKLMATEAWESPGFTFFKKGVLSDFCNMILWLYTTKDGLDIIKYYANKFDREQLGQGISDMTAFLYYTTVKHKGECIDAQVPTLSWSESDKEIGCMYCYDHNINIADNFKVDFWGRKAVKFINGIPYMTLADTEAKVQFKGLHFQGDAKYLMVIYQNAVPIKFSLLKEYIRGYIMYRIKALLRHFIGMIGLTLRKK